MADLKDLKNLKKTLDVNNDNKIDMKDAQAAAKKFGIDDLDDVKDLAKKAGVDDLDDVKDLAKKASSLFGKKD